MFQDCFSYLSNLTAFQKRLDWATLWWVNRKTENSEKNSWNSFMCCLHPWKLSRSFLLPVIFDSFSNKSRLSSLWWVNRKTVQTKAKKKVFFKIVRMKVLGVFLDVFQIWISWRREELEYSIFYVFFQMALERNRF